MVQMSLAVLYRELLCSIPVSWLIGWPKISDTQTQPLNSLSRIWIFVHKNRPTRVELVIDLIKARLRLIWTIKIERLEYENLINQTTNLLNETLKMNASDFTNGRETES